MNEHWMKMRGFKNEKEASEYMASLGAKSKGTPKSYNWLKDNPENASKAGKKGAESRWGKKED